jgi:hypothetical protein
MATTSPAAEQTPSVAVINLVDANDPSAAAQSEVDLVQQLRAETGMPALLGENGAQAFATLDAIEEEFAAQLIAELAAVIDGGGVPGAGARSPAGLIASRLGLPVGSPSALGAIDVSLFADTGFTASTIMTLYTQLVQRAADSSSGTLPRSEHFEQDEGGLHHRVDLSTTFNIQTGGGRVNAEIIMSATDNITNAATGSFVALYTSRSIGSFDVNACPDENGVAEGTYTFETKHELNDVSGAQNAQSAAGRSVDAPFRLIDGEDAHLVQIEASLDMDADGRGPGTSGGPGPTGPFDWGASQSAQIVMPRNGSTTTSGAGLQVTGTGGQAAGGAMFISSAMAQLFLKEVANEAERFWRSGKCIEIKTTEESRNVNPGEEVEFEAEAEGEFDDQEIDAPIKGTFSGKDSLDPTDSAQDPPAAFKFTAGREEGDKGIIQLEQVGVRGIGKKTIEFTVAPTDYRLNAVVLGVGFTAIKCDGLGGDWVLDYQGPDSGGASTFTLPEDGSEAPVHTELFVQTNPGTTRYVLDGTASVSRDDEGTAILHLTLGDGTVTVEAGPISRTENASFGLADLRLEEGDFCS